MLARGAVSVMSVADRGGVDDCQPFSRAPPVNRGAHPYKSLMSNENSDVTGRRALPGVRHFLSGIAAMANSPWGPKGGEGKGGGSGGDGGKKPGPRNPWVSPDPVDINRGRKPRGPSALDELLRKGRGSFGGGGGSGGGGFDLSESARFWKWGVLALVAVWLVVSAFHIVPPEKEGVVVRLGSYARTVGPGVKWTW